MSKRTHRLFWRRVLAYLIDMCAMLPYVLAVFFCDNWRDSDEFRGIALGVGLAYLLFKDGLPGSRSIGKRIMKLKVVDLNTDVPIGFAKSLWRNFLFLLYTILAAGISGCILSFILMLFNSFAESLMRDGLWLVTLVVCLIFAAICYLFSKIGFFEIIKARRSQDGLKNSDVHSKTKVVDASYKPELVRKQFGLAKKLSLPVKIEIKITRESEQHNAASATSLDGQLNADSRSDNEMVEDTRFMPPENGDETTPEQSSIENESNASLSEEPETHDDRRFMPPEMRESLPLAEPENKVVAQTLKDLNDNYIPNTMACDSPLHKVELEKHASTKNDNLQQTPTAGNGNAVTWWIIGVVLLLCFIVVAGIVGQANCQDRLNQAISPVNLSERVQHYVTSTNDTWEKVIWQDRWSFKLHPSLELQGGKYQSYAQAVYRNSERGFEIKENTDLIIAQPKGINNLNKKALKQYCRFIVEELPQDSVGDVVKYHDINPANLSEKAMSVLNAGLFEVQKEEEKRQNSVRIPFEILEWHPAKKIILKNFSAIEYGFLRKSIAAGKSNVLVRYFMIEGGKIDYKITVSYRVDEVDLWEKPLDQMLNSFKVEK